MVASFLQLFFIGDFCFYFLFKSFLHLVFIRFLLWDLIEVSNFCWRFLFLFFVGISNGVFYDCFLG